MTSAKLPFYYPIALQTFKLIDIQLILQTISVSHETYGIKNIGEGTTTVSQMLRSLRRSSSRGEERDLIGLEEDTIKLATELMQSGEEGGC